VSPDEGARLPAAVPCGGGRDGTPGTPGRAGVARDGLRLAVGTLTALPVAPPAAVDRPRARIAMLLAPAVALLPGAASALVAAAALRLGLDPFVAAGLAVGTLAMATRGLHLDGLADTADGLAASYDRARALAVMRRGNSGPAGVTTVALVLAIQVTALAQALHVAGPVAAVVAVVAGRMTLPLLCAHGVPAARTEGLGAAMAGSVPRALAAGVTLLTAMLGAGLTMWFRLPAAAVNPGPGPVPVRAATDGGEWYTGFVDIAARPAGAFPWSPPAPGTAFLFGALAVLAAALVAALLGRRAVRRFGGVTGDVLGACVEAGTAAALVVLAALPPAG
jgi:adenosylcobinamide-GDP ribazoletransferase